MVLCMFAQVFPMNLNRIIPFAAVACVLAINWTSCKTKKDSKELLINKWNLSTLKLPPSVEKERRKFEKEEEKLMKPVAHYPEWNDLYPSLSLEKKLERRHLGFQYYHNWEQDESFIKFYPNGTFTQTLPYVLLHGNWEYDEDKSEINLKIYDGSTETLFIDFINKDSLSAKVRFNFSKNSKLDRSLYMEFENCILSFKKDWHFYSKKLTDPFAPTILKWMEAPTTSPTQAEIKSRILSFIYFNEKLWEQRSVNQHKFYPIDRENLISINALEAATRFDFSKHIPWCNLFYDEEGFEKFKAYWNEINSKHDLRFYSSSADPAACFEAFSKIRKDLE